MMLRFYDNGRSENPNVSNERAMAIAGEIAGETATDRARVGPVPGLTI